jgi:hypothetical protein
MKSIEACATTRGNLAIRSYQPKGAKEARSWERNAYLSIAVDFS